jgi:hypothetical protein
MAKAKPVHEAPAEGTPEGVSEDTVAAVKVNDERVMPPVEAPKAKPAAPKADPVDLEAMLAEATADGKTAQVVGNAVRVDN